MQRSLSPRETGVRCVRCGHNLTGATIGGTCPECGELIDSSVQRSGTNTSGYAVASLVLGIISIPLSSCYGILGVICGGLAILFNRLAENDIRAGRAHLSSRGINLAGLICGIIGLCLGLLLFLLYFGLIAFSILSGI